ncbi:multidrug effflux MFS transporter [Pseudorhodoplanes sp.]|uniref:multidrug effflux MFS transporter n=1 Tax=Pseudorhodoplanes sp. TaxID=1934341 RepID=UPI002BD3640F|nr:multidrug effflux MFS transporter [Pseudorhodoplanes sp.]HWV40987.1 multidrug effflux MFS transporter [Pseudorhodoplanes sp.]
MLKPDTFALTALLAALTALGPLSTDLYLPTLPDIGRAFGVSAGQVQQTIYAYLIGFALGQVGYGPISDWYGRRSGLLVALVCYCAGSLICFLAPSIDVLIAARVLQAFGGSGAIVLARAVVRDFYSGARAGRELSMMGLVMAFGPVSAPLIGGALHTVFGWRSSFAALLIFGCVLVAIVARKLPETLVDKPDARLSLSSMLAGYRTLLQIRDFNLYLVLCTATYTGLIVWFAAMPFIYHARFGLTPLTTSLAISGSSIGFLIGTSIATRVVVRAGLIRTIGIGATCMVVGSAAVFLLLAMDVNSLAGIVVGVGLNLVGLGLVYPQALAGGLSCAAERAGAASSLLGGLPPVCSAILGAGIAASAAEKAWPAGLALLAMALVIVGAWLILRLFPQKSRV